MLPSFLVPESVVRQNGSGPEVDLGLDCGRRLLLTLGITRIIEQESLELEIWGSADRTNWGDKPLLKFPQKFYSGTYSMVLNLANRPGTRYLRVDYKLNRWGRGEPVPLFGFYVFVEETASVSALQAAVA